MTIYAHNNLFIQNKYHDWYYQIIDNARTKTYDDYSEKHHIIPSSLGGSDDPDNLVRLNYREHFLCHWLLIKFVRKTNDKMKMVYALLYMLGVNKDLSEQKIYTSWQFDVAKRIAKNNMCGENNPFYGKKHSEETRAKMSDKKFYTNGIKDIKISEGEEIPEGFLPGKKPMTAETREKLSLAAKNRSDDTKAKIALGKKMYYEENDVKWYNNGVEERMIPDHEEIPEGVVPGRLPKSEEARKRQSIAQTGEKNHFYGKTHNEKSRKKMSETQRKNNIYKNTKWYNNGISSIRLHISEIPPEGFVAGRLNNNMCGKKYYNNGVELIALLPNEEIPEGFKLGYLPRKNK
jgi:hypothetical protein